MAKGLQKKFLLLILVLSVIPLLTQGMFTTHYSFRTLLENNKKMASQDLEKMAEINSHKITEFAHLLSYVSQEERILSLLDSDSLLSLEKRRIALCSFMQNSVINYAVNYPFEYVFVSEDHTVFLHRPFIADDELEVITQNIASAKWNDRGSSFYSKDIWIGLNAKVTAENYRPDYIYLVSNLTNGAHNVGYAAIGFHPKYLWENLSEAKVTDHTNIYILDDSGTCIYSSPQNMIPASDVPDDFFAGVQNQAIQTLNDTEQLVLSQTISVIGLDSTWSIVSVTPVNDFSKNIYRNLSISVALLLLAVLGVIMIIGAMHIYIFKPLQILKSAMETTVEGDFDVKFSMTGTDEMADLFSGFQYMQLQLKKKIETIKKNEREKKKIEVQMLQAQINPHFICNSLNTIKIMADLNEDHAVSKSLLALSHLVSHYLHTETSIIPFSDEVAHLHEYLYLQKLRYHNSFSYQIHISKEVEQLGIMKLLLQPLVENCIVHGFQDRMLQGFIQISIDRISDKILIQIQDNGCGISPDILDSIFVEQESHSASSHKIGLINIQRRIQTSYGDEYGISISSNNGTTVTVLLPVVHLKQLISS